MNLDVGATEHLKFRHEKLRFLSSGIYPSFTLHGTDGEFLLNHLTGGLLTSVIGFGATSGLFARVGFVVDSH